jgi:isopentenyl diphosphate isomerase/L-lactate dehydrogenase-like FMN-dependent dehydrogenase
MIRERCASRRAARIFTVDDARQLARRRLPRGVFDYVDGAAEAERTMRANMSAFDTLGFRPRMAATSGSAPDLTATVLGRRVDMPLLLSPVGSSRLIEPGGDIAAARAAAAAGTVLTVSTMSGFPLEQVAAATADSLWFQLYFLGGRRGAEQLVDRARQAGYRAIVVTVDTQAPGGRERELRTRVSPPVTVSLQNARRVAGQVSVRPWWLAAQAMDGFRFSYANAAGMADDSGPMSQLRAFAEWVAAPARWEDFSWIRRDFGGPVIAKGVLSGDDAKKAVDAGASAIIVSNHGGRQLDRVPATMPALVEVLKAVGDQAEVLVDGGLRRGSDVVAAVALGARAAMIGRPWAYGLAAAGEQGVSRVLGRFRVEMDRTLRLLGCEAIGALDPGFVSVPAAWRGA